MPQRHPQHAGCEQHAPEGDAALHKALECAADAQDAAGDGKLCQGRQPQAQSAEQGRHRGELHHRRRGYICAAHRVAVAGTREESTGRLLLPGRAHCRPELTEPSHRRRRKPAFCLLCLPPLPSRELLLKVPQKIHRKGRAVVLDRVFSSRRDDGAFELVATAAYPITSTRYVCEKFHSKC